MDGSSLKDFDNMHEVIVEWRSWKHPRCICPVKFII
jgi:hypothetical protein